MSFRNVTVSHRGDLPQVFQSIEKGRLPTFLPRRFEYFFLNEHSLFVAVQCFPRNYVTVPDVRRRSLSHALSAKHHDFLVLKIVGDTVSIEKARISVCGTALFGLFLSTL